MNDIMHATKFLSFIADFVMKNINIIKFIFDIKFWHAIHA